MPRMVAWWVEGRLASRQPRFVSHSRQCEGRLKGSDGGRGGTGAATPPKSGKASASSREGAFAPPLVRACRITRSDDAIYAAPRMGRHDDGDAGNTSTTRLNLQYTLYDGASASRTDRQARKAYRLSRLVVELIIIILTVLDGHRKA